MLRASFFATGLSYGICCLSANYQIVVGREEPMIEDAIRRYDLAAAIFPFKSTFSMMPPYARIFFVRRGFEELRPDAIRSVEQALLRAPNSLYLQEHLKELKR